MRGAPGVCQRNSSGWQREKGDVMELVRVEIIMDEEKMETLKETLRKYHITGIRVRKIFTCDRTCIVFL